MELGHRERRRPMRPHVGHELLERRAIDVRARKQDDPDLHSAVETVDGGKRRVEIELGGHDHVFADVAVATRGARPRAEAELLDELHRIAAKHADRFFGQARIDLHPNSR
jgi:hypothetical protein